MSSKKIIKVNFRYFWEGFDPENNFFTNLLRKKYDVVIDEKPDYLFYSVYPERTADISLSRKGDIIRKISPTLYIILRKIYSRYKGFLSGSNKPKAPKGNFIKIFYGAEKVLPNMKECDFAFSIFPEETINNPNYMRLQTSLITNFLIGGESLPLKRNINFKQIKKQKTNFCNFVYSQDTINRNKIFKQLNKYKRIDAPGRCMNNMPPIGKHGNPKNSRISINWAQEKLEFLKKYKFTIAFENEPKDWYTTEKLVHPLMVNSIPIYFGNKRVGEDFNEKCFINYNNFRNIKELLEHIKDVDNDDDLYKDYLTQPFFKNAKQYEFNTGKKVEERLDKIISSKK